MFLWAAIAVVMTLGVLGVALGMRGRAVDDHPICRRCRYDLVGQPAETPKCPECGADLLRPRATRRGNRVRRRGPFTVGVVLILAAIGAGTFMTIADARGYN